MIWRLLFLVILLAGCSTASLDAPIPQDIAIQPPRPELPAPIAALSGVWTGQITGLAGNYLGRHTLIVQSISPIPENVSNCN
jgi:hypothetical protein